MASRMITNQRLAFLAQAQDAARRFQDALVNLSDAQRATMLARVAAKSSTPVDIVLLGEPGDAREAREAAAGHLQSSGDNRWTLGNGCEFIVEEMRR